MFGRMKKNKHEAAAIGIIGGADGPTAIYMSDKTNQPVRIIKRKGKTKLIIGKGLFKKSIKVPHELTVYQADIKNANPDAVDTHMHITIREVDYLNQELHSLIKRLDTELLDRYPKQHIYGVDFDDMKVKEMTFVVAYLESIPVGCGGIRPLSDGSVELKRFYVDSDIRGRGIASRILAYLEKKAKDRGFSTIKLETGPKQPEAINLYRKFGYYEIPLFGEYVADSCEYSVCMEKQL